MGKSFGRKAIFAGNVPQSGGEFVYEWNTVIKTIRDRGYFLDTCLLLGVAGGDAINALRKYFPQVRILGIELDPIIVDIALQNGLFKLDERITLKTADAIQWITAEKETYDLIIVDVYLGDQNVKQARKKTFLREVKKRLSPQGLVLYSCHYDRDREEEFRAFITLIKSLYTHVEVVFEYPKNKILLFEDTRT